MVTGYAGRRFALSLVGLAAIAVPAMAQQDSARSIWNHNGSTMSLVMLAAGAQKGSLLFTGQYANGRYAGTAFIYDARCGKIPYEVSGPVLDNFQTVQLAGRAPRLGRDCAIRGYVNDTLQFTLVKSGQRPPASAVLPSDFAGTWIEAGKENNACSAGAWDNRGSGDRDYAFYNRLIQVSGRELTGWEMRCEVVSARPAQSYSSDQAAVETDVSCVAESLSWRATELWNVRSIENRRHLVITTLKTANMRDMDGGRIANSKSAVNAEFLECR